eukprot:m.9657 g.9657  ORF g.9657 m.9657 type:complete len:397 (-) comp4109_c0_seq1:140-1330(-)
MIVLSFLQIVTCGAFSIGITGDVNLNPALNTTNFSYVWGDTIDVLRKVDLMCIQHESTLAEIPDKNPATIQFEDPLNYTETYKAGGIDYITIANNHQFDYGLNGLNRTLQVLNKTGIPHSGVSFSEAESKEPIIINASIPGQAEALTIAVFSLVIDECWKWPNGSLYLDGCTCGPSANPTHDPPYQCYSANSSMPGMWYNFGITDDFIDEVTDVIQTYKTANPSHFILTYLHIGPNFQWTAYPEHKYLLRNISIAGAGLVWGTSSHHIQRFEVFNKTPIVYGMGDFMFRHVVGVEDWCPIYARPCMEYHPELSLFYVFQIYMDNSLPVVNLTNITAYATKHGHFSTSLVSAKNDSDWIMNTFENISDPYELVRQDGGNGQFQVKLKPSRQSSQIRR